ncbi:hypothetical protein AVEN_181150-1 [Araneus ventricosus]|uniref:Uncharacterized protein n=1 Tax=Araneus ventricosus TaxID=182803 RepID=A0A4Y2L8D8_ARAVE|nr:hypothetical protein AVEN_25247-1 [Araneus ventricosus]GBN10093.1 hypothetical protein AVEN_181150-1 [Araneus ventricosus]
MLHAVFQNIKGFPHFGVFWRVSSRHSSPSESSTFIAWSCSQTAWQISKSASVAATGMSSSMGIPSSYSSFCIPSGRFHENYRRSHLCLQNGRPAKRGHEKLTPKFLECVGKVAPRCFLTSGAKNSTNATR